MTFNEAKKCGAKRRDGGRCRQPGMRSNGRCKLHGGKTPKGLANPNTRTGLYSRDLPTRLLARFGVAQTDPDLLSIRGDVAFVSTLLSDKLSQLEDARSEVDWADAIERMTNIQANWMTWDRTRIDTELRELAEAASARASEARLLSEIRGLIKERVDLVLAENKRLRDMQQLLTVEQVVMLGQTLVAIVRRHVGEDERGVAALREIHAEFRNVFNLSDRRNDRRRGDA